MFKNAVALAAVLVCGIASASTPITLIQDPDDTTQWSASFSGNANGDNVFTLDLSGFAGYLYIDLDPLTVTANSAGRQGYAVSAVTFDGNLVAGGALNIPGYRGLSLWSHQEFDLPPSVYTFVVTGTLLGNSSNPNGFTGFTGSLNIYAQPVPEPESYALMLGGLAALGFVARRRAAR